MTIQLKPEQERIIQREIQSGHFRSPDEVLDHALAALREKSNVAQASSSPKARPAKSSTIFSRNLPLPVLN